jgi:hypothetical protein
MAIDEHLADRVRTVLADAGTTEEKKMFGGLTFMLDGHMCCGVLGDDLIVRVGAEGQEAALAEPHVRRFDFTGKPLKGFVTVAPAGCEKAALARMVGLAVEFVKSLPPK